MRMRHVLQFISGCVAVGLIGLAIVLLRINPRDAQVPIILSVYLLLVLVVWGGATVIGSLVRRWHQPDILAIRHVQRSMRQGLWLAILVVAALQLAHSELLYVWTLLPLMAAISCLELYFLSRKPRQ